jgi:hypothetical protein
MIERLHTQRLFVIILVLGLFVLGARPVTDPDVWWHLRTGQLITQNHELFHADPYSFTKSGAPWVDHEWLSQIIIYGVYRLAGWGGLIAGFAALITVAYWILFLRSPGRPFVAGVMTVWGALASVPSWGVRPQIFTLVLASVLLLLLERSYQRPNLLWWTPPLVLIWVNLHAGYALGIAFLALFLVGDAVDLAFGHNEAAQSGKRLRTLALVLATCLAVVPLNPYGTAMYRYPFQTLHSRAMLAYIGEWASPDFHQSRYVTALCLMLATVLLPVLSPRRLCARELLLLAVTMLAALRSVRHIPIYALVVIPLLSGLVQATLDQVGKDGLFKARAGELTRSKLFLNAILLVGFLVFSAVRFGYVVSRQAANEEHEFPAAAAAFLATTRPPGPLMNHYNWGGYFIWKLYPTYKVFIDGRADLYGDSFLNDFGAAYQVKGKAWRTPLENYGVQTVVLPPDAPLVVVLKATTGWRTIFSDRQTEVLTRNR